MRLLLSIVMLAASALPGLALTNGFHKPFIGVNPFYSLGHNTSGAVMTNLVRYYSTNGYLDFLRTNGYQQPIMWHDAYWSANSGTPGAGTTNGLGVPVVDSTKFPDGMSGWVAMAHASNWLAGIYSSGVPHGTGYSEEIAGTASNGTDARTNAANQYATWGFDALKYDFVAPLANGKEDNCTVMLHALQGTGRTFAFEIEPSNDPRFWMAAVANANRYAQDFSGLWSDVLANLYSWNTNAQFYGDGYQPSMDYLMTGVPVGPVLTAQLTDSELESQFAISAVCGSQLILGATNLSSAQLSMLLNKELYDIDQDSLLAPGIVTNVTAGTGGNHVLIARVLASGAVAVAYINGTSSASTFTITFAGVGAPATSFVRDAWNHADVGWKTTSYTTATVASHAPAVFVLGPTDPSARAATQLGGGFVSGAGLKAAPQ